MWCVRHGTSLVRPALACSLLVYACDPSPIALYARQRLLGLGAIAVGLGGLAYAGLYRGQRVPAAPGRRAGPARRGPALRVLQVSDLHLTPQATARQRWVSRLAGLEPDLVINTGDNLAHPDAVPFVLAQPRPAA